MLLRGNSLKLPENISVGLWTLQRLQYLVLVSVVLLLLDIIFRIKKKCFDSAPVYINQNFLRCSKYYKYEWLDKEESN